MKGSYVVTKVGAEKTVSFDNGLNGSIAEDAYFAIKAMDIGFTFNFPDTISKSSFSCILQPDACIARPIILPPNLSASGTLRNTSRLPQKILL